MTLPRQTKFLVVVLFAIVGIAALSFPFRAYLLGPYRARQEQLTLPQLPSGLSMADLGMPQNAKTFNCPDLPARLEAAELNQNLQSLRSKLEKSPTDLCVGNQLREAVRFLQLRNGDFAIRVNSLPADLAAIAKDPNSIPTTQANSSTASPDELEPARSFRTLAATEAGNTPETQLQLGLSYVDLMIRQGGREHKARLSSRAIDALSSALDRRPYMIAARYARGLNYLYWPIIAGKLPLAVRDLKTCIALSNLDQLKDQPPLVVAEAYAALGDTYTKLADSALDGPQKSELLKISRLWWQEGSRRFPHYPALEERLKIEPDQLIAYIDSARGLETYINTDLDLLWTAQAERSNQ